MTARAFEQQRVAVRVPPSGQLDGTTLLRLVAACGQYVGDGYRLYAIEVVYERPVPVAAPRRAPALPPHQPPEG